MQKTKYIIVGQGLAGTILSFQLYKKGIPHKVVSSTVLPSASGVAAGMFNPLVFKRLTKSWMIDDLLPIMYTTFSELEQLLSTKLLHQKPIAKLINNEEKLWYHSKVEEGNLDNYFDKIIPVNSTDGINPNFDLALLKNSGWVDLKNLLVKYRHFLEKEGLFVEGDFKVNDVVIEKNNISWQNLQAEKIVFCRGSYEIENPYFPENVFYLSKGDVLTVKIAGLNQDYILNKDCFLLPKGQGIFVLGSTYVHNYQDWAPVAANAELLIEKAEKMVNKPIQLMEHNAGVRPTVKDRRPLLGSHPEFERITFFNGLGTKGVMLAPYFANEMLCFLEDSNYALQSEVNISRFYL